MQTFLVSVFGKSNISITTEAESPIEAFNNLKIEHLLQNSDVINVFVDSYGPDLDKDFYPRMNRETVAVARVSKNKIEWR